MLNKFIKLGFILTVFSLSLGQFSVLFRGGGSNIYLFDIVILCFSFFGILFLFLAKSFTISTNYYFFVIFTFIAIISLLFNVFRLGENEIITSTFYLIRWSSYLLLAIIISNYVNKGVLSLNWLNQSFFYSALFLAIVGFFQLFLLPDFALLDPSLGWDPHKNRIASTFFDPNYLGGYLGTCLALFLGKYFSAPKSVKIKDWFFFFLIPALALFLTFSRSGWAFAAIVVFVFGLFKSPKLLFFGILLAFSAYFAVPRVQTRIAGITDPSDSASFRLISWQNTLDIAQDNFLIGVGFNAFRFAQKDYGFIQAGSIGGNSGAGSDSSFLLVLATTGVFGFLAFSVGYLYILISNIFHRRTYSVAVVAILLGLLVQAQFINALFYPQIMLLWLVAIGFEGVY